MFKWIVAASLAIATGHAWLILFGIPIAFVAIAGDIFKKI